VKYPVWILAIAGALYGLHRIALWAEARGFIYYRKERGSSGTLGTAMLEIQSMLEPSKRHVIEERVKDDSETEDSGDPPTPRVRSDFDLLPPR
jgi:hypothetical protein